MLLVASSYPSHPHALWNLPGGRVRPGELVDETVVREVREETSLEARAGELAYVSESYDGARHVLAVVFHIEVRGSIVLPRSGDHVVAAEWIAREELHERLRVGVVREPLFSYLSTGRRYFGTHDAGISIAWPDSS